MKIATRATIAAPIDEVWPILVDMGRFTSCLPGVEVTEIVDANRCKANVALAFALVRVSYRAKIARESLDETTHSTVLRVEATDARGRANASALVTISVRAEGSATAIDVVADATVSGLIAQFGQGIMKDVAGRMVAKFAANVALETGTVS